MIQYFLIICTVVVTSLYYFPFELVALPGINTKMAMAVVGILVSIYRLTMNRDTVIPKNVFMVSLLAGMVSLVGIFAVTYNNTMDYAYASYLISMWVWLSAALVVCTLIEKVHGRLNVPLLCHYLITVSVAQCLLALWIDFDPEVKNLVDTYISQAQTFLNEVKRLYGIGAALDVAGTRFSACIILITVLIQKNKENLSQKQLYFYIGAYVIIAVVGNMIARTTSVGIIIGLMYLCYVLKPWKQFAMKNSMGIWKNIFLISILVIPLCSYLYFSNEQFHKLFRFAFEGFFNYVEYGEWETASTGKLRAMYVFPDNLKTWIIGDGYFSNPHFSDPNYVGNSTKLGYYMGTDVGYLRFIFYFGTIGLLAFSALMIYSAQTCMRNLPHYKAMFALLLLSNFVIWLKVSTDIFLVFALFICVTNLQEEDKISIITEGLGITSSDVS